MGRIATNLAGQRFGRLFVLRRDGTNKWGTAIWWVRCDCGVEKPAPAIGLVNGRSRSCGCLRRERMMRGAGRRGNERSFVTRLFNRYRYQAKKRDYCWELSREQFEALIQQVCHYCGSEPLQIFKWKTREGQLLYNGIDRKDNVRGYAADNALPCCKVCNKLKGEMGYEEFMAWMRRIIEYHGIETATEALK
jgi:hypothetical protein